MGKCLDEQMLKEQERKHDQIQEAQNRVPQMQLLEPNHVTETPRGGEHVVVEERRRKVSRGSDQSSSSQSLILRSHTQWDVPFNL